MELKIKLWGVFTLCCVALPQCCWAFTYSTRSYTATSTDERYVLVLISPRFSVEEEAKYAFDELNRKEILDLRSRYHESGLYRNDGHAQPLWTLEKPGYLHPPVLVANDGKHLVNFHDVGSRVSDPVLDFFEEGRLTRSYARRRLIDFPFLLPWRVGPTRPWRASYALDDARGRLTVWTKLGDRFVFDVATGQMLSSFRPARLAALTVLACLLGVTYCLKKRS